MHLDTEQVHVIRDASAQELVRGREDFKNKIAEVTSRQLRPGVPGRPRVEEADVIYYVF